MLVTEEVPLTNKQGKKIGLTLDTNTGVVAVDFPPVWGKGEVDLSILKARVDALTSIRAQHA